MLTFFSSAPPVRWGDLSTWWRRSFPTVLAAKTEDELADYLERHQHHLPSQLRIEIERHRMGLEWIDARDLPQECNGEGFAPSLVSPAKCGSISTATKSR
jgi:hypothetical protein